MTPQAESRIRQLVRGSITNHVIGVDRLDYSKGLPDRFRSFRRHSLRWAPNRVQIACVADDGDWDNIAVVNPDNSAGWNLASEVGDKDDPHYSPDGNRILYTRRQNGLVRLCDRGVLQ